MSEKYLLIGKPCQSGKTAILIEYIKELIDDDEEINNNNNVIIIFCDNSLLQTTQTSSRICNDELENMIMSSKTEIKNFKSLSYEINFSNLRIVICCCNAVQINNIDQLLKSYQKKNIVLLTPQRVRSPPGAYPRIFLKQLFS